nr:SlyX family protein [uncultured Desulfobacter sp.]
MDEARLMDIETKLAYQEKTIKELNDVVCRQQKEIDRLNALCNRLSKLGKAHAEVLLGMDAPANVKPPHY